MIGQILYLIERHSSHVSNLDFKGTCKTDGPLGSRQIARKPRSFGCKGDVVLKSGFFIHVVSGWIHPTVDRIWGHLVCHGRARPLVRPMSQVTFEDIATSFRIFKHTRPIDDWIATTNPRTDKVSRFNDTKRKGIPLTLYTSWGQMSCIFPLIQGMCRVHYGQSRMRYLSLYPFTWQLALGACRKAIASRTERQCNMEGQGCAVQAMTTFHMMKSSIYLWRSISIPWEKTGSISFYMAKLT